MKNKYNVGDHVVFLGSKCSTYGRNPATDKYIGEIVGILAVHDWATDPPAYQISSGDTSFWYAENCFSAVELPDLPEFECRSVKELIELIE